MNIKDFATGLFSLSLLCLIILVVFIIDWSDAFAVSVFAACVLSMFFGLMTFILSDNKQ